MSIFEHHHAYDPLKRVLESIHELFYVKNEIRGNSVVVPEWDMTITPQIEQCEEKIAVVGFYISDPDLDEALYECCASTGKDPDSAIGSCVGSFLFAFMNGIVQMKNDDGGKPVQSTFGGKTHTWHSYNSDLVGMGENVDSNDNAVATKYWDMLKEHIIKHLGNQKMCYVKIFASKAVAKGDEQITGEVRINDIPSAELGEIVYKHAAEWNVDQFASQKQFFFIKQDPETMVQNRYSGAEGRAVFAEKVKTMLEMYNACETEEQYDAMCAALPEKLQDPTLAEELLSFLPEIAAENAFSEMEFSEQIRISVDGSEPIDCYKSQLADYYPIQKTLFSLFSSGVFGDQTNNIYRKLIGGSSIYNCVRQIQEKGSDLEGCRLTSLVFNTSKNFEIR